MINEEKLEFSFSYETIPFMNDNTLTTSLIPQSQNILETEQIVSDTTSPSSATQIQEISVESNIIANFSHEDSYVQTKIVINV